MKIKDVVRGVEEIEIRAMTTVRAEGYNSLANTEVVVNREKMADIVWQADWIPHFTQAGVNSIVSLIATAIESGSIISMKEEE